MQKRSGGFIVLEFAIALPLLILVMYGLAIVSVKIFLLGKAQLADYALEAEARYVMELITQKARAAKEVKIYENANKIKIVYHAVDDWNKNNEYYSETLGNNETGYYQIYGARDVLETQYIFSRRNSSEDYLKLYAERQESSYSNPITGENFFGKTHLISLKYELDAQKKILHIKLEMGSLTTPHKIKIATAVFMPSYEKENS